MSPTHRNTPLTVLVPPVPVWSTDYFDSLEDSFEDDAWEVLPRCQGHSVTEARGWGGELTPEQIIETTVFGVVVFFLQQLRSY